MLARDQNLLLQPEVNPAVGLRHLNRCVQLADAWRKLGGNATVVHDVLPGRLIHKLDGLAVDLLPLASVDRVVGRCKPGWLFVDGCENRLAVECSSLPGMSPEHRWKLAATGEWAQANGTRFQRPDLLLSNDHSDRSPRPSLAGRILQGARYRMPTTGGPLADFQAEATTIPNVARKILIWLSDDDSGDAAAEMLADVIEVASDRTTVDVVASVGLRDSAAMVQLKKANPKVTIRYWASIDRRLQSMAPVHLAIVDSEENSRTVALRDIPVIHSDSFDRGSLPKLREPVINADRAFFRRSLSRLIRNRDQRESLIDLNSCSGNDQAYDRIARSLATSSLRLEVASVDDWSEVSRWQCDPESLASALPCGNHDAQTGLSEFSSALNRLTTPRWIFRLRCGTPIGMAALDPLESFTGLSARVQVLIKPTFRNLGYGTALLERVLEQVEVHGDVQQVIFQARSNDQAARRMAGKAGLLPVDPTVVAGVVAHQFGIQLRTMDGLSIERAPMQRSA